MCWSPRRRPAVPRDPSGSLEEPAGEEPDRSGLAVRRREVRRERVRADVPALYDLRSRQPTGLHGLRAGQRDERKLVPYVINSLLRESPQLSSGSRAVDWVYVDDVVDAFFVAAAAPDRR